jgi:hypothetical protein
MSHHTNNLSERAADIAEHAAQEACDAAGDYGPWFSVWLETYELALRELVQ